MEPSSSATDYRIFDPIGSRINDLAHALDAERTKLSDDKQRKLEEAQKRIDAEFTSKAEQLDLSYQGKRSKVMGELFNTAAAELEARVAAYAHFAPITDPVHVREELSYVHAHSINLDAIANRSAALRELRPKYDGNLQTVNHAFSGSKKYESSEPEERDSTIHTYLTRVPSPVKKIYEAALAEVKAVDDIEYELARTKKALDHKNLLEPAKVLTERATLPLGYMIKDDALVITAPINSGTDALKIVIDELNIALELIFDNCLVKYDRKFVTFLIRDASADAGAKINKALQEIITENIYRVMNIVFSPIECKEIQGSTAQIEEKKLDCPSTLDEIVTIPAQPTETSQPSSYNPKETESAPSYHMLILPRLSNIDESYATAVDAARGTYKTHLETIRCLGLKNADGLNQIQAHEKSRLRIDDGRYSAEDLESCARWFVLPQHHAAPYIGEDALLNVREAASLGLLELKDYFSWFRREDDIHGFLRFLSHATKGILQRVEIKDPKRGGLTGVRLPLSEIDRLFAMEPNHLIALRVKYISVR